MSAIALKSAASALSTHASAPGERVREHLHHPNVIFRIAGLPSALAKRLETPDARRLLDELGTARGELAAVLSRASEGLERAIGDAQYSQEERRLLLRAKRNLFNARRSGLEAQPELADKLGAEAVAVSDADAGLERIGRLESRIDAAFAEGAATARRELRAVCLDNPNFLKAVAFSAPLLIRDLLESTANPDKFTGKRGRNLDLALFNYFMRATKKVSPLSYFTPVLTAKWSDDPAGRLELDGRRAESTAEISRRALAHISAALLCNLAFWGESHPLELNPTIETEAGLVRFQEIWARGQGSGRTWGVYPPVSRLPANPRIEALIAHFRASGPAKAFSLRELFGALAGPPFGAEPASFAGYVAQAIRVGLLVPVMDVFEQEDLTAFLVAELGRRLPEAAATLRRLDDELSAYPQAPYSTRTAQSQLIHAAFAQLCAQVGAEPPTETKSPLFYEDCTLDGGTPSVATQALGGAIADLHRLSELFPLLDYNHVVQSVVAALFRQRHGDGATVDAVDCIESIADEAQAMAQRLTPLPLEQQEEELGKVSGTARDLVRYKRLLLAELRERMQSGDEVVIDDALIDRFAASLPDAARARATSYTVIGQTDGDGAGRRFVLNRLYSGHSMLMSRFLLNQDEADIERVSRYLQTLSRGARPVEIPGVFGFNANLHPQFVDAELTMPGRRANYRDTEKVAISELAVRYDPELDRLKFLERSGEEVSVHYFGFLNLMLLPNIYQVLGRMNLQGLILDLWQDLIFAGVLPRDAPVLLPRTTYRSVVVSRQSLLVPASMLPDPGASEADFFRRLHNLLTELGQACSQFVRLVADREDFFGDGSDGRQSMADSTDFKPAYLSLDMPLSVASLQRRLSRRRRGLLFQEELPKAGGVAWDGQLHACEVQLEISRTRAA
jgi:hypothetical protein